MTQPEMPATPVVTVDIVERRTMVAHIPTTETTITAITPDGGRYVLLGGRAAPVSWLPMPIIGCALISADAAWNCIAQFNREQPTPLQENDRRYGSYSLVLARALNISLATRANRIASDSGQALATVKDERRHLVAHQTTELDRVLSDLKSVTENMAFDSLHKQQNIILPRLDQIIDAMEHGIDLKGVSHSNAQNLFGLISDMPYEALQPYRERLSALGKKDRWFTLN